MKQAVIAERYAYAKTVCLLGDPIGCGGVTPFEDGTAETWAVFSPLITGYPKAVFKACRDGIKKSIEEFKLDPKMIYAAADPDDLTAHEFLERLGFRLSQWVFTYKGDN